jgi:hypothetical protein
MGRKAPEYKREDYVAKDTLNIVLPLGKKGHTCRLTTDENQYIISTASLKTDGTEGTFAPVAYLSTPEAAFNRIFEMNIRHSDATTLIELKDDMNRIRQDLYALFH